MTGRAATRRVLLVEDNPGDVDLVAEGLCPPDGSVRLEVASGGEEALAMLRDSPAPDLILLDLNLPQMDGRELLARLKTSPDFRRIPVVVFTSSGAENDIAGCYGLHANAYVVKSFDLDHLMHALAEIRRFWLQTASSPPRFEAPQ